MGCREASARDLLPCHPLGYLAVDLGHVECGDLGEEITKRGSGEGTRLGEHEDLLAEDHEGRDRLDAE